MEVVLDWFTFTYFDYLSTPLTNPTSQHYPFHAGLHCQSVLTDRLAKRTTLHVACVTCACLSRTPLRWNGRGTRSRVLILSYQSVNPLSFCHPSFDSDLAGLL